MLAHTIVTAKGTAPTRAAWFIHGILGTRSNLRSLARRFVEARPDLAAVLVDLRGHGESLGLPGESTLAECARDLEALARTLDLPVRVAVGHSFGGKVALAWLALPSTEADEIFVLDSHIGPREEGAPKAQVDEVIDILERTLAKSPEGFASREDFTARVLDEGLPKGLSDWLAMNLRKRADGGREFAISTAEIRALLASYAATDCWPILERTTTRAHVVIAGRGGTFTEAERARAFATASHNPAVRVHVLPDASHFVHVDSFEPLLALMTS